MPPRPAPSLPCLLIVVARLVARLVAGLAAGVVGGAAVAGCAAPVAAVKPAPPPAAPSPMGTEVEKTRERLQVAPWDLVFCAARGASDADETVTARNLTGEPVEVRAIFVTGDEAALFRLRDPPALPVTLPSKGGLSVSVIFAAPAATRLGVHRAMLRFQIGPTPDDGPGVDLAALVTLGREGAGEPSLEQVVEALGFAVNVKTSEPAPRPAPDDGRPVTSDEIAAPLFQRASAAPVAINPVARFSADGVLPFGHYVIEGSQTVAKELARLMVGQNQTLNPDLEPGGQTSFDPGDAPFGLWMKSGKRTLYSDDRRNSGVPQHAARVFPLRARGGSAIPNAYLVAFEESFDEDYQDCVFVLWNVKPAAAAAP